LQGFSILNLLQTYYKSVSLFISSIILCSSDGNRRLYKSKAIDVFLWSKY